MENLKTMKMIVKRDGRTETFDPLKIEKAVIAAAKDVHEEIDDETLQEIVRSVERQLYWGEENNQHVKTVDDAHNAVEIALMRKKLHAVTKSYIAFQKDREDSRTIRSNLFETLNKVVFIDPKENDAARENANVDSNGAMAKMLHFGTSASKTYTHLKMLSKEASSAHLSGDIHIHDLDFYPTGTLTCVQIDLVDLLSRGFNTGHGFIRPPKSIRSAAALVAIVLQSGQNSQHGGIAIHALDYGLAPYVNISFQKELKKSYDTAQEFFNIKLDNVDFTEFLYAPIETEDFNKNVDKLSQILDRNVAEKIFTNATKNVEEETFQAMEALIFNLNTLHSRAGSQTPFSSVNYGTDTSHAGRLVIKHILEATENGLGEGETPIFPIQIFRLKTGVSLNHNDVNYDLFKKACEVSAKRIYPNFLNLDATYNSNPTSNDALKNNPEHPAAQRWAKEKQLESNKKWEDPLTGEDIRAMAATMGCRTRLLSNHYDPSRPYAAGRGNASFTTINLPRLALETIVKHPDIFLEQDNKKIIKTKELSITQKDALVCEFLKKIDVMMGIAERQLTERFSFQKKMKAKNLPFLFTQNVWVDSDLVEPDESIEQSINHASLSVGYFGLAEALKALVGEHHGESDYAQSKGLQIISHMRSRLDEKAANEKRNWSLLATPAEGIAGRFVTLDREKYGVIEGVTDREYYTNSSHVPVYYSLTAFEKIQKEAPYNELANAGHILYVEMDGDPAKNVPAFESIVKAAVKNNAGYIAINHSLDSHKKVDGGCGYHGIIDNECPDCGALETDGAFFERLRRVTGYLTSDVRNMNNAKQSEISERVKHA